MKDVVVVGGGLAGLAAGWRLRHWDTVLLESGSRGRRPHPLRAARPVLAELGRARVRRRGIVHRRPPVRGGHHRGAGARRAGRPVDERQAPAQGADADLPVPHPHVAVVAHRAHQGRHQGERAGPAVRGHRAAAPRRRPGGPPAADVRLRERPQLPRLRRRPARGRGGAVLPDGHPLRRRPARDLGRCRDRLLQPRVEHRPGPEPGHRRRPVHPDPGHRHGPGRPRAARRRGHRDRAHEALRRRPVPAERGRLRGRGALRRPGHAGHGEPPGRRRPPGGRPRRPGQGGLRALRERRVPHRRVGPAAVGRRVRHRHAEAVVQHRPQPVEPRPGRRDDAATGQQHHDVLPGQPRAHPAARRATTRSCASTPTT